MQRIQQRMENTVEPVIFCRDLHKSYGNREVLHSVGLKVCKGEIFGFLGPSGAGKTTLVKILTGQSVYEGQAQVFGRDCSKLGAQDYRRIGILTDNCGLYDRLSVYDNLRLFASIWAVEKTRIPAVLQEAGLDGRDRKLLRLPAGKLSKGMRQRLLIARLLLQEPELLFLDEPTSGLDPAAARHIYKLLLSLRETGTTIFLTTHNMEEAHNICDRLALLHLGNIVETGSPDEVCRRANDQKQIRILKTDGEEETFGQEELFGAKTEARDRLTELLRLGQVETVHSSEPDLGTVFLKLTGKELEV